MNFRLIILLATLFITFILGCAQKVAGGGSSGTEAGNALTAKFVHLDGSAVQSARILLRPADYMPGDSNSSQYTGSTNSLGQVEIPGIAAGDWVMVIEAPGGALLRTIILSSTDSSINLGCDTVRGVASVSGSVPGTHSGNERVAVLGTAYETLIASNGTFHFDSLPTGVLTFQSKNATEQRTAYLRTTAGADQQTGELQLENSGTLLLDNFEDRNLQNRFGSLSNSGWWFLAKDSSVLQTNSLEDTSVVLNYTGDAFGTAIHTTLAFASSAQDPWAEIGVSLGQQMEPHDLSTVDSLVFYMRGEGSLQVVINSTTTSAPICSTLTNIEKNGIWARQAIDLHRICSPEQLQSVTGISWRTTSSADFWLDDVQFIGGKPSAIWP